MSQQVRIYRMLDLSPAALTPHSTQGTYPVMRLGDRITERTLVMTAAASQHLDPVQFNLNIAGTAPTSSSTINMIHQLITHDTTDMPHLRLKCADWNVVVKKNIRDAYIYQGEIGITAGAGNTVAVGGEVCVSGLVMDAGSTGTVTGRIAGQIIVMRGSCLPTTSYGLWIATESSAVLTHAIDIETQLTTTITNGIRMGNAATFTNAISIGGAIVNFLNLSEAGNDGFVTTGAKGSTVNYTLKVIAPDGAARYINLYSAA